VVSSGGFVVDAEEFRDVMARFPTGVTVVATVNQEGQPRGLTVNSLTSVSLDPPLVLVCIDRASSSHDCVVASGTYAVSILAGDQGHLARRFAVDPSAERFGEVGWPTGDPVLFGAAGWLGCAIEAVHPGGDHSIVVGRVEAAGVSDADALAFYRGHFEDMTR
jgi:3-hydroxy-9,10-secoandrosta-1,3,5(10)-triene-9,17-dione monooxygenase reductase component